MRAGRTARNQRSPRERNRFRTGDAFAERPSFHCCCPRMHSRPLDIAALRHDYVARGLRRADLDPDPIKQFNNWFSEAAAAEIRDVNAMSVATVGADGTPAARIVLLKGISERGFLFFTNYESAKGR